MSTTPQRANRAVLLIFAIMGMLVFCASLAFGIDLLISGLIKVPKPDRPVQTLFGVKAVLFVAGFGAWGGGVFWLSMREFRKGLRP